MTQVLSMRLLRSVSCGARAALPVMLLIGSMACSNGSSTPPAEGAKAPTGSGAAAARTSSGNACDRKWITQADVDGILSEPVATMGPLEGDPQSCLFKTATFSTLTVATRPGVGKATLDIWLGGRMGAPVTPVAGVGDQAVWQDTMKELIATKADLLCDISVTGGPGSSKLSTPDLQKRLGGLCTKIFSAQ